MSTTTSNTEPDRHGHVFAWLGGSCAKCRPRSTPAADTEQLCLPDIQAMPRELSENRVGEPALTVTDRDCSRRLTDRGFTEFAGIA